MGRNCGRKSDSWIRLGRCGGKARGSSVQKNQKRRQTLVLKSDGSLSGIVGRNKGDKTRRHNFTKHRSDYSKYEELYFGDKLTIIINLHLLLF